MSRRSALRYLYQKTAVGQHTLLSAGSSAPHTVPAGRKAERPAGPVWNQTRGGCWSRRAAGWPLLHAHQQVPPSSKHQVKVNPAMVTARYIQADRL